MSGLFDDADIIHAYSRQEAINDGVLVDVTPTARQAGFRYPVALTRAAWEAAVTVPAGCDGWQDETGRLWDVVYVASVASRTARPGASDVRFTVSVVRNRGGQRRNVRLKALVGPGDTPDPVITVMLPEET